MTQVLTIHDSMGLAEQLWPNANWTAALKELWIGVLKDLRQDILADAMREVRAEYTSREPELKWVRAKYGALYEQRHPLIRTRENGTNTWHVSWQRTSKHGVPRAWYGCRVQAEDEAARLAKQQGGKATCMDGDAEQVTEHELREEHRQALAVIFKLPRPEVEAILARLRSVGFCKDQLPAQLRDWPRMAVLAAYAAHTLRQQERQS